jgi:hypothetical protein
MSRVAGRFGLHFFVVAALAAACAGPPGDPGKKGVGANDGNGETQILALTGIDENGIDDDDTVEVDFAGAVNNTLSPASPSPCRSRAARRPSSSTARSAAAAATASASAW